MNKKIFLIALGVMAILLATFNFLNKSFNKDLLLEETINVQSNMVNETISNNQIEEIIENQVDEPEEIVETDVKKEETSKKAEEKSEKSSKKTTTNSSKKVSTTTTTKKADSSTSTTTSSVAPTQNTKPNNTSTTQANANTLTNEKETNNETTKTENVTTTTPPSTSSNTSTTKPKEEIKQEQPKPEEPKQEEKPIIKDEYVRNDAMIAKIKEIILSNPSQTMIDYGFEVVTDSSIIELTNYFTFTEKRVKAKMNYKFGTIKIYAQDQYYNGEYIQTQCFIL